MTQSETVKSLINSIETMHKLSMERDKMIIKKLIELEKKIGRVKVKVDGLQ